MNKKVATQNQMSPTHWEEGNVLDVVCFKMYLPIWYGELDMALFRNSHQLILGSDSLIAVKVLNLSLLGAV